MSDKVGEPYAYMSSALTGLDGETYKYVTKDICERVLAVCQSIKAHCYCPHLYTPPAIGVALHKVYDLDRDRVKDSAVVVAYVGIPSFGVGMEIEMAKSFDIHVILLGEVETLPSVSRLVLGSPAVKGTVVIERDNPEKWQNYLAAKLHRQFSLRTLKALAHKDEVSFTEFEQLCEQVSREPAPVRRTPQLEPILTEDDWRKRVAELRRPPQQSWTVWGETEE